MDADPRQFIKVALDLPTNPKVLADEYPAAVIGAMVIAWDLCAQSYSDGHFQLAPVLRLGGIPPDLADRMIERDIWHRPGHTCDRCPQPKPGWLYAHDYLEHQQSSADRARLSRAGRKAAAARWSADRNANRIADGNADRISDGTLTSVGDPVAQPAADVSVSTQVASFDVVDKGPELGEQALFDVEHANRNAEERRGEERRRTTKVKNSWSKPDQDPHFTAFWAAYPRKVGRLDAWKAWSAIPVSVDREAIIAAAKRYAEDPSRDPQFTKHPGPWLRAGRWLDGPPERPLAIPGSTPTPPGRWPNADERVAEALEIGRRLQAEHDRRHAP